MCFMRENDLETIPYVNISRKTCRKSTKEINIEVAKNEAKIFKKKIISENYSNFKRLE